MRTLTADQQRLSERKNLALVPTLDLITYSDHTLETEDKRYSFSDVAFIFNNIDYLPPAPTLDELLTAEQNQQQQGTARESSMVANIPHDDYLPLPKMEW